MLNQLRESGLSSLDPHSSPITCTGGAGGECQQLTAATVRRELGLPGMAQGLPGSIPRGWQKPGCGGHAQRGKPAHCCSQIWACRHGGEPSVFAPRPQSLPVSQAACVLVGGVT